MPSFDRPMIRPFMSVREVPERFRPCVLWREPDSVLIAVHPGTGRLDLIDFIVRECDEDEQNAYRAACGQGPVGTPLDPWMTRGAVFSIPPELRLREEMSTVALPDWPNELVI